MDVVNVLSRYLHVVSAVVMLGGSIFLRFVLMPAARQSLSDTEHDRLRGELLRRWKKIVHAGIGLLLLTGFWNYYAAISKGDLSRAYHPLMGTKILLGLGVMFLASVLVGRSAKFEGLRRDSGKWLGVTIALSLVVVAIGSYLKVLR